MAEENNEGAQAPQPPIFRLQKMYLKDLSFENPEAPDVFLAKGEPKVDVNLGLKHHIWSPPDRESTPAPIR